jgi:hypothetical protein
MYGRLAKVSRRKALIFVFWSLFAAGLLIQLFAPHLKVSNGAFVIPEALNVAGNTISPQEIVGRERLMQFLSAVLTVSGALGLAFLYRDVLFRRASREVAEPLVFVGFPRFVGWRHRTSTTEDSQ